MTYLSLVNLHTGLTIAACFCLLMLVYHLCKTYQDHASIAAENASNAATLSSLKAANHNILNDEKGKQGEDAVYAAVTHICDALGLDCITNRELKCPNAILLPQGTDTFSKEIDLVLVSNLGVYVFEVKNWHGGWSQKSGESHLLQCNRINNQVESRPAPLAKTQRKLEQLLKQSGLGDVPAESLVVFTNPQGSLDPNLSTNYLHISELSYFFRTKFACMTERNERYDIQGLFESIWDCLDRSPHAMHNHMMRLSPFTDNIKTYQTNHKNIVALEKQPVLEFKLKRPLKFWVLNATFFIGLVNLLGIFR